MLQDIYEAQCCIKYFQKVFQLQITKYILKKVFQLLLSITLDKWPKIQNTFIESNLNTKLIQESLRVNQSINQ